VQAAIGYVSHAAAGDARGAIYVTEPGWQSPPLAPDIQAANLRELFTVGREAAIIAAVCWFQIADNPAARLAFGLCHADYFPKPAFAEFARVNTC
jgi:hypothetical protein